MIINEYGSSCKVPVIFFQILMKLEFSRKIVEKYSNVKFNENPCSGGRDVPCGRTDRHNEASGRFSQFWEGAYKLFRDSTQRPVAVVAQQHRPSSGESYINRQHQSSLHFLRQTTVLC